MNLPFSNGNSRTTVGLDIDGGYLAAVEAREGRIVRAVSEPLASTLVADGEVNDGAGLSSALKDFFKRHGLPRRVQLGVANGQIAVRSLDLPPIEDAAEQAAAVRFQAADAIAMPLEETVLDYHVVGESTGPEGSPRIRVVVVAARESMIASLVEATRTAGLRPLGIDLSAFAVVRAVAPGANGSVSPDEARVFCHLAGVANLAVAVGSTCLFTRALTAPRDEAGQRDAMALAEEIRLSIDFYMSEPGAPMVSELVLSGPESAHEELVDQLGELVSLPVRVAEPLANLDASDLPADEDPRRHTVAAGLAIGAAA